jgi:hypothetical protein
MRANDNRAFAMTRLTVLACVFMVCCAFAYSSYMSVVRIQIQLDFAKEMRADKMSLPLPKI